MNPTQADEILWRHIRDLPYFRAMLRAVEDSFYQELELPHPMLDLGCGDGHFASVAFTQPPEVGLDPWREPIVEAGSRHFYPMLTQSDGARMPFPDGWFASVISTSVLEHIPHIDEVLAETARVTRAGGTFAFCVPNQRFPETLLGKQILTRLGFKSMAEGYSRWFNRMARHAHTDSPETWISRLEAAGFSVERCWDYFPPQALHVLECGPFLGVPALFARKLTGRWILAKTRWNLWPAIKLARPFMDRRLSAQGVCTFFVARRKS